MASVLAIPLDILSVAYIHLVAFLACWPASVPEAATTIPHTHSLSLALPAVSIASLPTSREIL